jgi:hypothetical protein
MKQISVEEIVNAISDKYRNNRQQESILSKEIHELEIKLKNEKNTMTHKNYIEFSETIHLKESELEKLKEYNNGIYEAREVVMNFWK